MDMPETACVGIFWDYENCHPPSHLSGSKLIANICRLVQGSGTITQFKAYIDLSFELTHPRSVTLHSDLQSSGVTLAYCPHNGKKDVADKMMIVDMLAFALDRPPPAKIVVITGDRDFAYAVAILRLRGYQIVVISPSNTSHASLKLQADQLFDWKLDVIGATSSEVTAPGERTPLSTEVINVKDCGPRAFEAPDTYPPANRLEPVTCFREPVSNVPSGADSEAKISARKLWRPIWSFGNFPSTPRDSMPSKSMEENEPMRRIPLKVSGLPTPAETMPTPQNDGTVTSRSSEECSEQRIFDTKQSSTAYSGPQQKGMSKPLSTLPSNTSVTEQSPPFWSVLLAKSDQSPLSNPLPEEFNEPENLCSNTNAQKAGSDEDADDCCCTICSRSYGVIRDSSGLVASSTVLQSEQYSPAEYQLEIDPDSSTDSPTSVSTMSRTDTTSSTWLPPGIEKLVKPPTPLSKARFRILIDYFIEQRALSGVTRIRSATVASEMRKRNPRVYEDVGVLKMKQYIEEARKVDVIITPGMDNEGDCWIEINPTLYPNHGTNLSRSIRPTMPSSSLLPETSKTAFFKAASPSVEAIFDPLVARLRMEPPSYRLLYSMLGMYFKAEHPNIYERASVPGLSQYLQMAEERGVIRTEGIGSAGRQCAELMEAHRHG